MIRLIVGLIKGLVVGGLAAYGAMTVGLVTSFFTMIACIATGAVVGVVAGRAPWRAETLWTPAIKAITGAIIGGGLGALALWLLPSPNASLLSIGAYPITGALLTIPAVGALFGAFVEVDDGGSKKPATSEDEAPSKPRKR